MRLHGKEHPDGILLLILQTLVWYFWNHLHMFGKQRCYELYFLLFNFPFVENSQKNKKEMRDVKYNVSMLACTGI
jgi:hypothetical protein